MKIKSVHLKKQVKRKKGVICFANLFAHIFKKKSITILRIGLCDDSVMIFFVIVFIVFVVFDFDFIEHVGIRIVAIIPADIFIELNARQ